VRLAKALEAHGRSVWWDRDILAGQDFSELISAQLAQARIVIVLWSKTSVRSQWVRDEAREAAERGVLVPILLDVTEPPIGFRSIHSMRWDEGLEQLLASIEGQPVQEKLVVDSVHPIVRWLGIAALILAAIGSVLSLLRAL
jgi:TIR domain